MAWTLAQEWFVKSPHRTIPINSWNEQGFPDSFVNCGLAEMQETGVYVKGANEQFQWLLDRRSAGSKGGLKSQEKRSKQTQANASKSNPLSLPLSLSLKKETTLVQSAIERDAQEVQIQNPGKLAKEPKATIDLESAYKLYPRKQGKSPAIRKLKTQIKTEQDLSDLTKAIKNYAAFCHRENKELQFVMLFSTFANQWRDWLDSETGTVKILPSDGLTEEQKQIKAEMDQILKQMERR